MQHSNFKNIKDISNEIARKAIRTIWVDVGSQISSLILQWNIVEVNNNLSLKFWKQYYILIFTDISDTQANST